MIFEPERISKCASLYLNAPVEQSFSLFGPIKEMEWAEGWDPEIIYSTSEFVEEYMIFRTKGQHVSERHYTWVITRFNPKQYQIEYTVSTANRIWFINIECAPQGLKTVANVRYTYTGLTELGNDLNKKHLKEMYLNDLKDWELAINYYLENGTRLTQSDSLATNKYK